MKLYEIMINEEQLENDIVANKVMQYIIDNHPELLSDHGDEYVYQVAFDNSDAADPLQATLDALMYNDEDEYLASQAPDEDPYAGQWD